MHHVSFFKAYLTLLLGGEGNWTADGCRLASNTNGIVSCECDHLTNFGVLVVSLCSQNHLLKTDFSLRIIILI